LSDFVDYNYGMARPPKEPRLRMTTDLRIPVTAEQKAIISDAIADEPDGFAAWARRILLAAAQDRLDRRAIVANHGD
jgi:hypothetical protein